MVERAEDPSKYRLAIIENYGQLTGAKDWNFTTTESGTLHVIVRQYPTSAEGNGSHGVSIVLEKQHLIGQFTPNEVNVAKTVKANIATGMHVLTVAVNTSVGNIFTTAYVQYPIPSSQPEPKNLLDIIMDFFRNLFPQ